MLNLSMEDGFNYSSSLDAFLLYMRIRLIRAIHLAKNPGRI
jgi:hypothetical protein